MITKKTRVTLLALFNILKLVSIGLKDVINPCLGEMKALVKKKNH